MRLTPLCKRCNRRHFNFLKCDDVPVDPDYIEHAHRPPAVVIRRHEPTRRDWHSLPGSFRQTGDYRSGRHDKTGSVI